MDGNGLRRLNMLILLFSAHFEEIPHCQLSDWYIGNVYLLFISRRDK